MKRALLPLLALLLALGCESEKSAESGKDSKDSKDGDESASKTKVDDKKDDGKKVDPKASGDPHVAGGVWRGKFKSKRWSGTVLGLVDQTGKARFVSSGGAQFVGEFDVKDGAITTEMTSYVSNRKTGPTTVEAKVEAKATLRGTYKAAQDQGKFSLEYEDDYDREVSLEDVADKWGGGRYAMTVAEDGSFTGKDRRGCVYTGAFAQVDPRFNAFTIKFDVTECKYKGSYEGQASLLKKGLPVEVLAYGVANDKRDVSGFLARGADLGTRVRWGAAKDAVIKANEAANEANKAARDARKEVNKALKGLGL